MSYTNPDQTATYNQTTDITDSQIVIGPDTSSDTYAKQVNLTGGKVISGATVRSGGYANSGNWVDITVESGGSFRLAGGSVTNLTAASGAELYNMGGGACAIIGNINIESGAIYNYNGTLYDVYTDEDGWVHNWAVRGAVHIRSGVKFKDPNLSSFLYVSAGCAMWGGSGNAGGLPIILANGSAIEFTASKAEINRTGVILGGSMTTISNYIYVLNGSYIATGTAPVGTFSVKNGVVSDLALKAGYTKSMVDLTLVSGMNAASPVISSGGSLILKDGGSATGAVISSAGTLSLGRGGTATDVVWTPTEGMIYVYDGAHLTFANELTGVYYGSSNVLQSHETEMTNLTLDAAAKSACVMNGGKVTDTTVNNGYLYVWHGGEASGITVENTSYFSSFVVRGGHVSGLTVNAISTTSFDRLVAIASSGAFIEDVELKWGRLGMSQGATVSGATVTGGALDIYDPKEEWHYDRPGMLVNEATVTAGRIFFRGSNASGANIVIANTDATANHIQNGAYVSGLTIRSGKMVVNSNGTLVDGDLQAIIEDVKVSGGNLSIGYGAAKNVRITGGNIVVFGVTGNPGVVEDISISGGKVTVLSNGALVSSATVTGYGVYDTTQGKLVYTSWGSMDIYNGSGRDIMVSGGQVTVSGGVIIDNVTVTGSGGSVGNISSAGGFQGGRFVVSNARVNNLVVSGAKSPIRRSVCTPARWSRAAWSTASTRATASTWPAKPSGTKSPSVWATST